MFQQLPALEPDPILGLLAAYRSDPRAHKIDLGVGVYQDEQGQTPIMRAVREAERHLLATETTKTYLGIAGDPQFNERLLGLLLGVDGSDRLADRVRGLQTPGGCGALRIGAETIRRARPDATVWVSTPTWANHLPLIGGSGLRLAEYPYYDADTHGVDFDAMIEALGRVPAGDVVLLHGCCHNPTGADLSIGQWRQLTELLVSRELMPYVDIAYQGLADGIDEDVAGVRYLLAAVPEAVLATSCSKNFGLYRERVGAVYLLAETAAQASAVQTQAMAAARQIWSMPPAHGAAVVAHILGNNNGLRDDWESELAEVRGRISAMRTLLAERLAGNASGIDFGFIRRQKGMFSYFGIRPEQVKRLREDHAVYMMESTRINLAGVTRANINALANAVHAVLAEC